MIIEDMRTDEEKKETIGFVIATTYFNWLIDDPPKYPYDRLPHQKHLIVYPIRSQTEINSALRIFRSRYDYKNVRYTTGKQTKAGRIYTPNKKEFFAMHIHKPGTIVEFIDKREYRQLKAISDLIVKKENKKQ